MADDIFSNGDIDALHILPLSIVPLRSGGLRKTRMLKTSRLEGVVEIFGDRSTGSGQVRPDAVASHFLFEEESGDVDVIARLGDLPSYDVYSLRRSLRDFGVAVENTNTLQLSKEAQDLLTPYMREFTRPLVEVVYGGDATQGREVTDIIKLFSDPDVEKARRNLTDIADKLGIDLDALPVFLSDYGDVYLSLAYYQRNLDDIQPHLTEFLQSMRDARHEALRFGGAGAFLQACNTVEQKLKMGNGQIDGIMDVFRARTENMWADMSQQKFDAMKVLINDQQTAIGSSLCAIVVKLKAWAARFPRPQVGGTADKMNFVVSEMLPGIEAITPISV